jgi:hypothetical protein
VKALQMPYKASVSAKVADCALILKCLVFLALISIQASVSYATPQLPPSPPPGTGIQRTMRLLASSTPEHPNSVYILFYGQSISKQPWWLDVARDLRERFPSAKLRIENRAIGGFATQLLVKTAEYDIYPADPDLVIINDYGDELDYENIIRGIRSRTKAEVALQSDHLITWGTLPGEAKDFRWTEWHNNVWLRDIARKYGCGLIDIRAAWKSYLTQNKLEPRDLLADYIHLNARGMKLMGDLVEQYLQYNPALPQPYEPLSVVAVPSARRSFDLAFTGNRVDLVAAEASTTPVHFLIDGKRPSEFSELPVISRPNDVPGKDWPWQLGGVIAVGHRVPLVPELWTVKIDSVNKDSHVAQFELLGSVTGEDGQGSTDRNFVSASGRVTLQAQDWWTVGAHNEDLLKPGQLIRWRVLPMSADQWSPAGANETITVANGLSNIRHNLRLYTDAPSLPIRAVIVQKPRYTLQKLTWPPYLWQKILWLRVIPLFESSRRFLLPCLALLICCLGVFTVLFKRKKTSQRRADELPAAH